MAEEAKARRSRKANGDARPQKRKDGRFKAHSSRLGRDFYGKTAREAREKRAQAEKDAIDEAARLAQQPAAPEPEPELFGDFLDRWVKWKVTSDRLASQTARGYRQRIRDHIKPALGALPLTKVSIRHLDELKAALLAKGLSPSTVRGVLIIAGGALGQSERWELRQGNPARLVGKPGVMKSPGKSMTREEVGRLLAGAKDCRLVNLFAVAVSTGMRQAELFGLKQEDIDWERNVITVRASVDRHGPGSWSLKDTKTHRIRQVPMTEETVAALKAERRRQLALRLKAGQDWQENGLVFASGRGTPLFSSNTDVLFHKVTAKVGISSEFRFHDLRHTAGSLMLESGMSLKEVQLILGHSTITTTADIYSHVAEAVLWEKMRRFGDYLRGNG